MRIGIIIALALWLNTVPSTTEIPPYIYMEEINTECVGTAKAVNDNSLYCQWGNFTLTQDEFELLCTTVYCEAGNQDMQTQTMVALTVLNRLESEIFPNTITEVIYEPEAYSVTRWRGFESYGWTEQVENAVYDALKENCFAKDMYYFRTKHYHTFGQPYMKWGDLWFSTEGKEVFE